MANGDDSGKEIEATVAGQRLRAKGYRLADLIWPILGGGMIYIGTLLYQHTATADDGHKKTADVLVKSNEALLNVLKENSANTVRALEVLTAEQRRSTSAMKEVACLNDPAMRNRADARDFCKRISQ